MKTRVFLKYFVNDCRYSTLVKQNIGHIELPLCLVKNLWTIWEPYEPYEFLLLVLARKNLIMFAGVVMGWKNHKVSQFWGAVFSLEEISLNVDRICNQDLLTLFHP